MKNESLEEKQIEEFKKVLNICGSCIAVGNHEYDDVLSFLQKCQKEIREDDGRTIDDEVVKILYEKQLNQARQDERRKIREEVEKIIKELKESANRDSFWEMGYGWIISDLKNVGRLEAGSAEISPDAYG